MTPRKKRAPGRRRHFDLIAALIEALFDTGDRAPRTALAEHVAATPPRAPRATRPKVDTTRRALPADFDVRFLGEKSIADVTSGVEAGGHLSPGKVLNVWREARRDIYLAVDPAARWSEQDCSWIWLALAKMEREFPRLTRILMTDTREGSTSFVVRPAGDPWTNTNMVPLFVVVDDEFQRSSPPALATNYYALGARRGRAYSNVPFAALSPTAISGRWPGVGPGPIYRGCSRADARALYLREGLLDSLLHERIHGFISQYFAHDVLFRALRPRGSQPDCEYDLEELLVKEFLLDQYDERPGVFTPQFLAYWRRDAQLLRRRVEGSACYRALQAAGLLALPLIRVHPTR